jgi:enediyne biosynthesis protein E4
MRRFGCPALAAVVWAGFVLSTPPALPQGMVSGNVTAAARPKFSGLPFPVTFVDVAKQAGLDAVFVNGRPDRKQYIVEANGTGVAFLDYNNDGLLDIFLVNSTRFEPFPPGKEPTNHLYRNDGDGRFTDVTAEAGMRRSGWGNGVCGADIDNDGHYDLFVTYWGHDALYRNQGDGSFEEIGSRAGVAGPKGQWSTGCTFLDYDRDGYVDLLVTSYVGFSLETAPKPGEYPFCYWKGTPVYCGPRGMPHGNITLYRNKGDGTFEDRSEAAGIRAVQGFYAFTAVAADLNGDGWVDMYVASDSTPSMYFRNNRNGTFTELATEAGIAYNEHGAEQAGMGISVADYDNDGHLDIVKTNFIRDYPNLYRNHGKGFFSDLALPAGLAVNPEWVVWGTGMEDLDNDGWRDIFQVTGHVYPEAQAIDEAEPYQGPRLVYRNLGNGKFEDVSSISGPGVSSRHASHGAAFGDFDNDGAMDVLIQNMDEPASLLRNDLKSENRWVKVLLEGTKSNRAAIGSIVTVEAAGKKQTATVMSQSSFLSINDPRLHFGLGGGESVERITVRWASGDVEVFPGGPANSLLLLVEGSGTVKNVPLKR